MIDIAKIQDSIAREGLDGWLLYDFRRSNDLACRVLSIEPDALLSRRFFYWIPQSGEAVKVVSRVEPHVLDHLPGKKAPYASWKDLEERLAETLRGVHIVAMEYSPRNAVPYLSKVDAGTVEMVRGFGVEVRSSADLLQEIISVWDARKLASHRYAAEVADATMEEMWSLIADRVNEGVEIDEFSVSQEILRRFAAHGCMTDALPICAVNAHSADPHYVPTPETSFPIRRGDFVLIDLWCRQEARHAAYADICQVGVVGAAPTPRQQQLFSIVYEARHAATELVRGRFRKGEPVFGWEADAMARSIIDKEGYGAYFTHRTGHNIDERDHGDGAHLDSFETQEQRKLLANTCFSVEPGIYLPGEFGVRLEYDVYVHADGELEVTCGQQDSIRCLLK